MGEVVAVVDRLRAASAEADDGEVAAAAARRSSAVWRRALSAIPRALPATSLS
ncbi:hypothetical protein AB0I93_08110 [Streptomyces sp. NPDC049967]|uniref:hypothetical protein n=1 Tax=Streptomyces sp. NPDC049967 TaxID=3155658 RepID=UPI003438BD8F